MTVLTVLKRGYPVLNETSAYVDKGEDVKRLVKDLFDTMYANNGIGLAAPQVNQLKRIFVMDLYDQKRAIINPVIVRPSPNKITSLQEGCLSVPGKKYDVQRHKYVTVKGYDENWEAVKLKCRGLMAFCIQHEVDHLDGILIGGNSELN